MFAILLAMAAFADPSASSPTFSVGETVYVKKTTDLKRFPSADAGSSDDPVVGQAKTTDELEVVYIEQSEARVRDGATFGWVPVSELTREPPAGGQPADSPHQ